MEGYNGTIFAYGQTGSGKTYTIQGPGFDDVCLTEQVEADRGILPRAFEYIFSKLEHMSEENGAEAKVEYLVRTTYLEIYNEQIVDLLSPTSQHLQIREDIKKGVYVEGLIEEVSSSAHDMLDTIKKGAMRRHTGCTSMNKESSRSHSVLSTVIESKIMKDGLFNVKISKFHLIDLAGSERAKSTDSAGTRLKEAGMINKSLSALGNVINSLVEVGQGKSRHVHYRDSKLTFLLRDSLGGNSKTLMIANISPSSDSFGETLSTLKFAQRAKLIKNKAIINEDSSGTVAILKDEIKRLKLEMTKMKVKHNKQFSICSKCGGMSDSSIITEEDLTNFDGDDLLADLEEDDIPPREAIKKDTKIEQLENLLKHNLNQLTQMQDFYDKEVSDKDLLIKRYKRAVDNYEKQNARDNMIIKFRDSTITRFGNLNDKIDDEKLQEQFKGFVQEIKLLKDQMKENPKLAASHAEIEELKIENEKLRKESGNSEGSYCALYKSNLEFLNELKDYIDLNEEERQERTKSESIEYIKQIEDINQKLQEAESQLEGYRELLSNSQADSDTRISELEGEIQKINNEIKEQKEKEIKELKEKLIKEEIEKNEIREKHQDLRLQKMNSDVEVKSLLSEKDKLSEERETLFNEKQSLFNAKNDIETEKLNIEKLFEQMKEQYNKKEDEFMKDIDRLKKEIKEFNEKVGNMQNSLDLNKDKIEFLEGIKRERETLVENNKKQIEEITNLNSELRKYESEVMSKADEISGLSQQLSEAKNKVAALAEELDTSESQHIYKLSELEAKLGQADTEHNSTKAELKKTRQQLESEQERTESLKQQFEDEASKRLDTVDRLVDEKRELEAVKSDLEDEIKKLKDQLSENKDEIQDLIDTKENNEIELQLKSTQIIENEQEILDLMRQKDEFQDQYISVLNKSESNEREVEEIHKKIKELKKSHENKQTQIQSLRNECDQKSIEIKTLNELIDQLKEDKAKERVKNQKLI